MRIFQPSLLCVCVCIRIQFDLDPIYANVHNTTRHYMPLSLAVYVYVCSQMNFLLWLFLVFSLIIVSYFIFEIYLSNFHSKNASERERKRFI